MQLPVGALKIALGVAAVLVFAMVWLFASALQTSDRHLSDGRKDTLVSALKNAGWSPGSVALRYRAGCDECRSYAADLASALALAGWSDKPESVDDKSVGQKGLEIVVADLRDRPRDADALAEALIRANIRFRFSTWNLPLVTPAVLFVYPKG